jgi:bacterioferritin (cytochrome b1)/lipopolysaccharide export system protein LptC
MSHDLDKTLLSTFKPTNPIGFIDGSFFIAGMKKMAEGEMPEAGAAEGPFLVPLPQAVELIAQMVSNEFKTQTYYVYYANMLRGLSHEGIAEEFMEHAGHELEHADYLLRRMSVLSPGGVSIPPYPPPEPLHDPNEIVQAMIVVEQMGLTLWKQLHSICGENPMKFTIEQFLQREEEHQDELWQLVEPAGLPAMPVAEAPAPTEQSAEGQPASTKVQVETTPSEPKQAAVATYDELRRAGLDPSKSKKAADLTAGARSEIKDDNFVFPAERKYPIHDKDHALAALGMVGMHGTSDEKSKVRAAVEKKFPGIHEHEKKAAMKGFLQKRIADLNKDMDAIHHKDQVRVEFVPQSPAALRAQKPDVQKKTDNAKSPKDVSIKPVGAPISLVDLIEKGKSAAYVGGAVLPNSTDFFKKHKENEKKSDMVMPDADSPEAYIEREQQLGAQQAMAEASHAKTVAMQASQAAQQAQAEAQAAQQQLMQAQQQVEQLTQQSQMDSQQAMMATQQASEAEGRAADHSIQKMQLGMRVNQMRQELANFVMQDPVAESAATVSDLAAQGMPATPQQQAEAEVAAQTGVAPGQEGAPGQDSQDSAPGGQEQAAGGQEQPSGGEAKGDDKGGKPGTHVTVKTSVDVATIVGKRGIRGAVGAAAAPAAGGLGALIQKARPYLPAAGAAAGGLALAGGAMASRDKSAGVVDSVGRATGRSIAHGMGEAATEAFAKHAPNAGAAALAGGGILAAHSMHARSQRKSDMADSVAEGIRRAKTGSHGDTAERAVNAAINHGVGSAQRGVHALGPHLRDHMPAFVAGLGTGILGTKVLSSPPPIDPSQQQY